MSAGQVTTFLLSISIMLLLAKLLGEIFIKLKQPAIIGEILAGILLGPTVLGMISPDTFQWLFPQTGAVKTALDGITTLAVVLLLLVSGLEVDLSVVLRYRKTAVTTSLLGIAFPFMLGFGIAYIFPDLFNIMEPETRLVFSLFIGTAIAISSLPVIAKILMDLNIFKTQIGFIIIAAAMLNDLIGWLIFSIILGMIGASGHGFSFGETLLLTLIFVLFVLLVGRKLTNRLVPVIQNKFSFPGGILNFILILGFLGAAFTEFVGVHAILGAFIVGIAIGDSVHLRVETREIIQQFITNIFAPLFFVSIGLSVNFITNFNLPIVIIILVLALIGKVTGCSIGARIGGLKRNDALAVGFGMSSSGAMGIIIGLLALQFGLIHEEVFVGLVIMALATSIASAPLMNYFLRSRETYSLNNLITPRFVLFSDINDKNKFLNELINLASVRSNINKEKVYSEVVEREKNNPTGIANYLAIPHSKIKPKDPVVVIGVSRNGLDFNASDGRPAKVIFLLLTPENNNELQLKLLSEIVKKFKNEEKVERLLEKKDKNEFIKELKKL